MRADPEKTLRLLREQLQIVQSAEETTGPKIFAAVKRMDALLDGLAFMLKCPMEDDCPLKKVQAQKK